MGAEMDLGLSVNSAHAWPCPRWLLSLMVLLVGFLFDGLLLRAEEPKNQAARFAVRAEVAHQELSPKFCWFHPRAAALPGFGTDGRPAVIITLQKHLAADDHYSGLYQLRSDDLGKSWSGPTEIPELAWQAGPNGETIAVCDVTPGWHAPTKKLLAIGIKLRYSPTGKQLLDQPRSHEPAYAVYDPQQAKWSRWKMLAVPDSDNKFFLNSPGCVQWLVKPDGELLLPTYYQRRGKIDYEATVLQCRFDGETLSYVRQGSDLAISGGRGFAEPSLAVCGGRYYLTLRNDARGYVSQSEDGLSYTEPRPWMFDDGTELGSYNTQAHWLIHGEKLYLCYTRKGAMNDHIPRNRAPIFMAEVDRKKLQVLRATEQSVLPERGVMLGNFGAAAITDQESWITDAEFLVGTQPHPRGANGSLWIGRIRWTDAR